MFSGSERAKQEIKDHPFSVMVMLHIRDICLKHPAWIHHSGSTLPARVEDIDNHIFTDVFVRFIEDGQGRIEIVDQLKIITDLPKIIIQNKWIKKEEILDVHDPESFNRVHWWFKRKDEHESLKTNG